MDMIHDITRHLAEASAGVQGPVLATALALGCAIALGAWVLARRKKSDRA